MIIGISIKKGLEIKQNTSKVTILHLFSHKFCAEVLFVYYNHVHMEHK